MSGNGVPNDKREALLDAANAALSLPRVSQHPFRTIIDVEQLVEECRREQVIQTFSGSVV